MGLLPVDCTHLLRGEHQNQWWIGAVAGLFEDLVEISGGAYLTGSLGTWRGYEKGMFHKPDIK